MSRWLVISDLQIPFEHPHALRFCKNVIKEFKIPKENTLCVGDEVDQYFGGLYKRSIDGHYTANQEIKESKDRLKEWYRAFPFMRIANSNHGQRWAKKAFESEIPSQMMRDYREVLEAPKGWHWRDKWVIQSAPGRSQPKFALIHGLGYGGMYAYRHAALDLGMSVAFGHLHASAGIAHIQTTTQKIWGMNVGSMIDAEAYAFEYGKHNRNKPFIGCGVVLDDGRTPILLPLEAYL